MQVTKPQKAVNAEMSHIRFPCIVFPKIDGVRGIRILPHFTGRTLKPFANWWLTDTLSNPVLHGLDGELANGSVTSSSLCRDTTSYCNSFAQKTSSVIPAWYIFDYITPETAHLPYHSRWELAQKLVQKLTKDTDAFYFLKLVPHATICNTLEEVEACHQDFISQGFEGTVGRDFFRPHKNGRATTRENGFWRIKDFVSDEGVIIGYEEGQTNLNPAIINELGYTERSSHQDNKIPNGMIGNLKIWYKGREETISTGSMTHAERTLYFNDPSLILNKICTFTHMPYGAKDKLRFAQFANFRCDPDL
jgi:DNA ligase-1